MRVLLASSASHVPPRGGSTRSNLAWLEQLSKSGHIRRVIGGTVPAANPEQVEHVRREIEDLQFERPPVEVQSIADPVRRAAALAQQIRDFHPDWVLVSSEDIGQALLRAAHENAPGRVVYLAHTPQFYPFGPASWNPDAEGTELVARAAAVVAIGRHMADYIRKHAGCRVEVIHPPIYGPGPFARCGAADGSVLMINPCAVKGISIFLALAARFPKATFSALPGWGTTAQDRRALAALPNVSLLRNSKNIDDVLARTSVLLMPPLWLEGFGLIVVEAMLREIPVIASDSGGLVEAKLGTNFVISVRQIEQYEPVFDDQGLPRAVLPEQDIGPWAAALDALLRDRDLYERESAASREAALGFVNALRPARFEEFLIGLAPGEPLARRADALEGLSPDKRALLLERLRAASKTSRGT